MADRATRRRANEDKREGKAPSTQAGEFVREEIHHVREGKHGAANTKQAIAIGLSKARKAGVDLPPPKEGTTSEKTRRSAERAYRKARSGGSRKTSQRRSRATPSALERDGHAAASRSALSRQAKLQARKRSSSERSRIAEKASRTRARNRRGR